MITEVNVVGIHMIRDVNQLILVEAPSLTSPFNVVRLGYI